MSDDSDTEQSRALSSDDDEQDDDQRRMHQRGRLDRNLPRFRYTTFGEEDDEEFAPSQRRRETKEEATYGVFLDNDDEEEASDRYLRNSGKMRGRKRPFAAASVTSSKKSAPLFVKGETVQPKDDNEEMPNENSGKQDPPPEKSKSIDEKASTENGNETEEESVLAAQQDEAEWKRKQEEANERFLSLLNRAKQKKKTTTTQKSYTSSTFEISSAPRPPSAFAGIGAGGNTVGLGFTASAPGEQPLDVPQPDVASTSIPRGLGMPKHFGGSRTSSGRNNSVENTASSAAAATTPSFVKKDPNVGAWEKHTKGIGMKLLAKMGYSGSGGLGSKRRREALATANSATGEQGEATTSNAGTVAEAPAPVVRTGISRPLEVKVRPANLGLGFGNFKEATKLKVNQEIEAQVRGLELPAPPPPAKKSKKIEASAQRTFGASSSALPTVKDLMQDQSWKRGRKNLKSRKSLRKTVVPYTELLQTPKEQVIIDMRGPAVEDKGEGAGKEPPLAEELLHNLSFLMNTYENKVHSLSHFVRSTEQKLNSLQSEMANMEQRKLECDDRISKFKRVLEILDEIEALIDDSSSQSGNDLTNFVNLENVRILVQKLGATFSAEERQMLKFNSIIAPAVLGGLVQSKVEQWSSLDEDPKKTEQFIRLCLGLASSVGASDTDNGVDELRRSILLKELLPRIKKCLQSSKWDPVKNCNVAVTLYESLFQVVLEFSPTNENHENDDDPNQMFPTYSSEDTVKLSDLVRNAIIHDTIYPKLSQFVNEWKPVLDSQSQKLENPLDLWILPWVLHLDFRGLLPAIIADCKRKIRSAVSFLQKSIQDDPVFFEAIIETLRPWRGALKKDSLQNMVSSSVTPRLGRHLSKMQIHRDVAKQVWDSLDSAIQMNNLGLLSDKEFLSVIEGDALPHWVTQVYSWLSSDTGNGSKDRCIEAVAANYVAWKTRLLSSGGYTNAETTLAKSPSPAISLLQQDEIICRIFYTVLLMLEISSSSSASQQQQRIEGHELRDLCPSTTMNEQKTNYRIVMARRSAEEKRRAADDLIRMETSGVATTGATSSAASGGMEARVRLSQAGRHNFTFRDVVEEFARERDILFQPRMGNNAFKDGKQVFLFGTIPIYLDSNVVFALLQGKSEWKPMALDELAKVAES